MLQLRDLRADRQPDHRPGRRAGLRDRRRAHGPERRHLAPELIEHAVGGVGADAITGDADDNVLNGSSGADSLNVAGDGGGDLVNCGSDSATDTVTKVAGDTLLGTSCNGDTIVTAP